MNIPTINASVYVRVLPMFGWELCNSRNVTIANFNCLYTMYILYIIHVFIYEIFKFLIEFYWFLHAIAILTKNETNPFHRFRKCFLHFNSKVSNRLLFFPLQKYEAHLRTFIFVSSFRIQCIFPYFCRFLDIKIVDVFISVVAAMLIKKAAHEMHNTKTLRTFQRTYVFEFSCYFSIFILEVGKHVNAPDCIQLNIVMYSLIFEVNSFSSFSSLFLQFFKNRLYTLSSHFNSFGCLISSIPFLTFIIASVYRTLSWWWIYLLFSSYIFLFYSLIHSVNHTKSAWHSAFIRFHFSFLHPCGFRFERFSIVDNSPEHKRMLKSNYRFVQRR